MDVYQYATGWAVGEGYGFFHESTGLPPMAPEYRTCRTGLTLDEHAYEMYPLKNDRGIVLRTSGDKWFYTHALVGAGTQSSDELLMLMKEDRFISQSEFLSLENKRQKGEAMPLLSIDTMAPASENETLPAEIKNAVAYATVYLWRNSETGNKAPCAIRVSGNTIAERVDSFYQLLWSRMQEPIKKRIGVCFGVRWEERSFLPNRPDCVVITENAPDAVPFFDLTTGEIRLGNALNATDKAIADGFIAGQLPSVHETAAKISGNNTLKYSYSSAFLAKQIESIPENVASEQQYDRLIAGYTKYEELLARFNISQAVIRQIMYSVEGMLPSAWKRLTEAKRATDSNIPDEQHLSHISRALSHVLTLPKEDTLRREYLLALQEYVGGEKFKLLLEECIRQKCPGIVFEEIINCDKLLSKDEILLLVAGEKAARTFEPGVATVNSTILTSQLLSGNRLSDFSTDEKLSLLTQFSLSGKEHNDLLNALLDSFGENVKEIEVFQKKINSLEDKKQVKDHLWLLYLKQLKEKRQPKEIERILSNFSGGDYRQDRLTNLLTICAEITLDSSIKEKIVAYSEECSQHGIKDENNLFMLFEKQPDKACMLSMLKARNYELPKGLTLPNWTKIRKENFVSAVKQNMRNKRLSELVAYRKSGFAMDCKLCPDGSAPEALWTELEPILLPELLGSDQEISKESSLEAIQACFREINGGSLQNDWLGTHISKVLHEQNMLYKVYRWNVEGRKLSQGVDLLNELASSQTTEAVKKSIAVYLHTAISVYPERPTKETLICGLLASSANVDGYWEKFPSGKGVSSDAANELWDKDGLYLLQLSSWTLRTLKALNVDRSFISSYVRCKLLGQKKAKAQLSATKIEKNCKLFDETGFMHELRGIVSEK